MRVVLESIAQDPGDDITATVRVRIGGQVLAAFSPDCEWTVAQCGSEIDVEFLYLSGAIAIDDALAGNPNRRKELVWRYDWKYDGYGEITAVDPVTADFGPLTLELGPWCDDLGLVGRYIRWPIDRLDICEPE